MNNKVDITGDNQWTDAYTVSKDYFDLSVTGTFSATVTVQRKLESEDDSAWRDVVQYTAADLPIEKVSAIIRRKWQFRVGVKTGDYTSGTVTVEII